MCVCLKEEPVMGIQRKGLLCEILRPGPYPVRLTEPEERIELSYFKYRNKQENRNI